LVLGSGAGARRLGHRHPRGPGRGHTGAEEGAIARTPKTTTKSAAKPGTTARTRAPAKPARAPKAAAAEEAAPARPAARAKAAPKAKPAARPKAATAATKPKAAPAAKAKAAARPAARTGAKAAPKAAAREGALAAAAPKRAAAAAPAPRARAAKPPAAPRPARSRKREKLAPDRLELLVAAAMKSLEDDKAEDIVLLDVTGRADYADRLIVATGKVERQLQAMAQHLDEALGKAGLPLRRDAIQASPDWVLIDAGDLVIHLFRPEARELYRIERMWGPESPGASNATPG
jgi:ribosome silencing factor RsfS/YbeB/iojap